MHLLRDVGCRGAVSHDSRLPSERRRTTVERIIKAKGQYDTTVTPDTKVADVIEALETDDGKLAGIVGVRDLIKLRLDEVQGEATAMREYIGRA